MLFLLLRLGLAIATTEVRDRVCVVQAGYVRAIGWNVHPMECEYRGRIFTMTNEESFVMGRKDTTHATRVMLEVVCRVSQVLRWYLVYDARTME